MITPGDIVKHIKKYIGIFTDEFTDYVTVDSATVDADNTLTVTSTDHGLTVGKNLAFTGGATRNTLISAADGGNGLVIFETEVDHDLIEPSQPLDDQTCTIVGFGTYDIEAVPNRRHFSVAMDNVPDIDGSQYLVENISQSLVAVATVPDSDTFTLDLTGIPELPVGSVDDLELISGFRISAAADFERAVAAYSTQIDPYLFVIMGDADASKDRHTLNDGTAGFTRQDANLLKMRQEFTTAVFFPTTGEISGVTAQNKAYDAIFTALTRCLFGYTGEDDAIITYLTVPVGHGAAGAYNSAWYAHSYQWEFTQVVNYQDGFLQWPDVAFRDIALSQGLLADEDAAMDVNINLDDEEL